MPTATKAVLLLLGIAFVAWLIRECSEPFDFGDFADSDTAEPRIDDGN